ncbi:MAG: hypothetical protein QOH13_1032, partial [Thermoleophilaceae bacterium]|nr:hypothetical protein [Thermoleophilaceae bacterium]
MPSPAEVRVDEPTAAPIAIRHAGIAGLG